MSYQKLAQALNDSVNMYTPDVLYPRECLIVDVNEDETLKIKVNIGENIYLDEVRYIGIPKTNTIGLFIPLNNNYDEGYCICYNETTESLTENVIINNINSSTTEKVNEVNDSEEETSEEITNEASEETQANINYDRRYAKINHTHTENVGTIEDLKTLIKNTKEGNILSLNQNFKNERYGNIIINKKITIDGNGHSIENISFTCDANEIELNNITFFNATTNRVNGGALQLNGQRISINNCIFYNNIINGTSVYEGGAISVNSSSIETKITDCYFISNFCSNNGGAIRWIGNDGVLIGCKFIGNSATNSGGAIKWQGGNGLIKDSLFEKNKGLNGNDIYSLNPNLLCIGNSFFDENTIYGTDKIRNYITNYEMYSSFGRNILPNTKDMVLSNANIKVTYDDELFRNNKVVYFDNETVSSNGYRDWYYRIPIGEFDYGDEFTLSFWIKGENSLQGKVKSYFYGDSGYIGSFVINTNGYDTDINQNDGRVTFDITDEWKKCYVTWKIKDIGNLNINKTVTIRIFDGYDIYLSSPKFERGNVYTDWTPNPNDKLDGAIPINASSVNDDIDLNDYVNTGLYYQSNNSNSQYVLNKPTNDNLAFSLFVEKQTGNGVKQTLTYYDYPKTSRMFVRIKHWDTDDWTKWERIQFTGMNEGGANLLNIGGYYQSGGNEVQDGIMHNGHKSVYINNLDKTSSQYTHIHWTLPLNFHNYNEIYTLSFWAKCSDDNSVDKYITVYFGGASGGYVTVKRIDSNSTVNTTQGSFNDGKTDFKLSKEWQHFYVVYQLNNSGDLTVKKQPIIRVWGETEAYISSPKLERGYNVSDWTPSVLNAELIYPNMDLNDFTMKGEYRCPLTAWVKKISNVPIGLEVAFNLKVEPTTDNGCIQTFSTYLPYKTIICKRSMYNNDWSNWDLSITEPYICSVTDENYGTGTNGFGKLFKIYLNNTWYDSPISFEINQRGLHRPIKCYLKFKNENSKNPTIEYFTYDGQDKDIYICNEEEKYYTVYVRKTWDRDFIEVKNFNFNERYSVIPQRARIYAINEQVSSVPYKSSSNYNSGQNDKKAVNVVKIESNNDITLSNNLTVNGDFSSGNIVTELSTSSTDEEIPTAKTVYDSFEQIFEKDYNVNDTILNKKLYVGKLIQGSINSSSVMLDTNNELVFTTVNLYNTYWFIQKMNFAEDDDWDLSFNIRKPVGSYSGKDFGIIIGDENNYIKFFMGFYDIVITVNDETELSKRSGGVNATSDTPIKISRRGNDWEFDYNNGEYVANVSTNGYDIPNKFIVQDMNWSKSGSIYINNVVFNPVNKKSSIFDLIYPIGSIYMSVNDVNPNVLFGGRWEQLKDRFLLGSGDTYANGSTGGSATVSLTKAQMPRHNHTQAQHRHKQMNKYSDGTGSAGAYMYSNNRKAVDHYTDYQTPVINHTGGTGTTNADANGSPHENMPPYLTVYMWKRIS